MPVTIKPATHTARKHSGTEAAHSAEALLKAACPSEHENCKTIIQTSFKKFDTESPIHPSENGFVYACVAAYCDHHHLVVRPEDIWFAILTQLSLHVNANAEGLRSFFVAHEGQKELWIRDEGSLDFADFGAMARRMGKLVARHVIDPELRPWIIPTFSTTIESDQVVSSVIMMGALQNTSPTDLTSPAASRPSLFSASELIGRRCFIAWRSYRTLGWNQPSFTTC